MSQENVEIVRSFFRAPEPGPFFDLLDEEIEVDYSTHPLPDFPVFVHGKDEAVDWWRHYWGTWAEYTVEPLEIIDAGDERVVVVQRERGRGRGSGVPFEIQAAVVYTLRAGKVVRAQFYSARVQALEAVGLSEQDSPADS
jgi:ketosteroid isomerase-like protein